MKQMDIKKIWLSRSELKELLDIKDNKTLNKLIKEEDIQVSVLTNKLVYFEYESVMNMFERHRL